MTFPKLTAIFAVVNTVTNRVVRLLGKDETVRWMNLTVYQGAPSKKGRTTLVRYLNALILPGVLKLHFA